MWYGANRHSEGNLPKWVERLANDAVAVSDTSQDVLEPTNNLKAEQEAVDKFTGTHNDTAVEEDVATFFEPIEQPTRAKSKYSLRGHVTPPNRLYNTSLWASSIWRGSDVRKWELMDLRTCYCLLYSAYYARIRVSLSFLEDDIMMQQR